MNIQALFGPYQAPVKAPDLFCKAASDEQLRIERLVQRLERSVKRAFLDFVRAVQSPDVLRDVAELLGRGDIEAALQVVDRYVARMAPVVSEVFLIAAREEVSALASQVRAWAPSTGIAFDPTNERAAALMRDAQLQFIREMTQSQREAIRQAITQGLMDGAGPRDMARQFRNAIGLTTEQLETVDRYRRVLEGGQRVAVYDAAFDYDLRDRRFDPTLQRARREDKPLTPEQIDRMVERYRQRYIAFRAETIAITETGNAISAARQEGFDQITEQIGIPDDQIEREWRVNRDGRERWSHGHMQVSRVQGREAPFITGNGVKMMRPHDPKGPASERIRCRCNQIFRIRKPERNAT
ncbi:hypothetical protein [Chelativorans sp. AA-79]|uniref:hypothetical protein n=1 Tax=Chelativorans sp. AA-79 TaxID=3028735 RepID=UPI0023F86773|nr:hypothetical protein [Chelativorans sp. AA-79]WEX10289.1 hypothetical protein PVE73_04840 [Chelativorans sp. AA-79]